MFIRHPSERDNCIPGCEREVQREVLAGGVQST